MSRKTFIVLITASSILIILLSLVVKLSQNSLKKTGKFQVNVKSNTFPLDVNNKAVTATRIIYTLEGTLTEVNRTSKGTQLATDIKLTNLPTIIVNRKTQVFLNNSGKLSLSRSDNLKPQQKVRIFLEYGTIKNSWLTNKVEIIQGTAVKPQNSPSPKPK